jgi:hypothetical protein
MINSSALGSRLAINGFSLKMTVLRQFIMAHFVICNVDLETNK